uniref:Uncharacterized protein n=1 Tax=Leersia perrieri TaxID=77586 RepID=A0A0D9VKM2_9ORYZ
MTAGTASRRYIGPLLGVNLVMHAAVLGLAGWSLNKFIDRETHRHLGGNTSTGYLLVFSLMAGVVGVCSVLPGLLHVRAWRGETVPLRPRRPLDSLACKHITLGNRGRRLRTLEAFIAILTLTQLLYLVLLHAGSLGCGMFGLGCRNSDDDQLCRGIPREEVNNNSKAAGDAGA